MSSSSLKRAWRKAGSRFRPKLPPSALTKVHNDLEQAITGAPDSVFSIPQSPRGDPFAIPHEDGRSAHPYADPDDPPRLAPPGAVVRSMGTSRRVFLINQSLTPTEIDGLAYRIRTMASGRHVNSVVVANPLEDAECGGDLSENATCLPSYLEVGLEETSLLDKSGGVFGRHGSFVNAILHEQFGDGLGMPYVSDGYDASKVYQAGIHSEPARLERELMAPLASLSRAVRGSYDETVDSSPSKVPLVTMPHGLVTDAGYSLLLGSYVLATHSTAFRILNPLRGLAFDPVGLSYLLPRVGWEFKQASREYSDACAILLSLCGFEASAEDMVATGLATHYVGGPHKLNMLERALEDLNPFEYQSLHPTPKKLYGREDERVFDINETFKNVPLANVIQHLSEYDAAGKHEYGVHLKDELDEETGLFLRDSDPSLTMPEERNQLYGELESDLVNYAATFADALGEPTPEGVMERLREIAATGAEFEGREGCEEDVEVAEQAGRLVKNMQRRSPLALCVMHKLLSRGARRGETLESCMSREAASQTQLFGREGGDFVRWAESGKGVGLAEMTQRNTSLIRETESLFSGWSHSSVREVSRDEVLEIVGDD